MIKKGHLKIFLDNKRKAYNIIRCMKREKRALLLMPEYVWGGAETQFRYLLEYAEQHQWKIDVIIEHRYRKADECLKKAKERLTNINLYEFAINDVRFVYKIIKFILKNIFFVKYDSCLIYYVPDLVIAPYIRMLGIPVIYSERIDAAGIAQNRYYQKCLNFCSLLLANSEYGQKRLEYLTKKKVTIIKNGKPFVNMFPINKNRKISRILVPARITPSKNQMLLLYYLKQYPDFEGKILFAGIIADKSYHWKLCQFVRRKGLQDKVLFLGHVEELSEEYRKADLVVLPSFAEGTPNVVLEAYAYGRPVIVSDIGELRKIVSDSSMRFGIKNPEEICACIRYVEDMPEDVYRQLMYKNREYVLQNYSIETMAESFGKVIYNIKKRRNRNEKSI